MRKRRARRALVNVCLGLCLGGMLALAGCGQKGPLFLPGHSKDTPWPLPPSAAAPPPADGAPGADADAKGKTDASNPAPANDAPGAAGASSAPAPTERP